MNRFNIPQMICAIVERHGYSFRSQILIAYDCGFLESNTFNSFICSLSFVKMSMLLGLQLEKNQSYKCLTGGIWL